jgi:hypothetical protein
MCAETAAEDGRDISRSFDSGRNSGTSEAEVRVALTTQLELAILSAAPLGPPLGASLITVRLSDAAEMRAEAS